MEKAFKIICSVFIFIYCNSSSQAQTAATSLPSYKTSSDDIPKDLKPLAVGAIVPDIRFNLVNSTYPTARISTFKGKLILIDFWATWCWTCINSFAKTDLIQQKFKDEVQVLLVNSEGSTGDTKEKVLQFLQKRESVDHKVFPLAVAVEDSSALELFPHREIPHCVWIDPSGRVVAITSSDEVTEENIRKVLNGEELDLAVKKDFFPDKLMYLDDQLAIDNNMAHYSIFKKGKFEGLPMVNRIRKIDNDLPRGVAMRNVSVLEMYQTAIMFKQSFYSDYSPKRMVLELEDSSDIMYTGSEPKEIWERDHLCTYDVVVNPNTPTSDLFNEIMKDLNAYSGYTGHIEKRKVKCLLLVSSKTKKNILNGEEPALDINDGKVSLKNAPGFLIASGLNRYSGIRLPIINKLASSDRANISMDVDDSSIPHLRQLLAASGINLVEAVEDMDMLVIRKNNKSVKTNR